MHTPLRAATQEEALEQLESMPHDCGDTSFAPSMQRSHDGHGLWLVFRGPCPKCTRMRDVRFLSVRTGAPATKPFVAPPPSASTPTAKEVPFIARGGEEERELYGSSSGESCSACDGQGEYFGVTGDYATGMVRCGHCAGTGRAR
jgi:hypothetical protein